ncbi:MAG TPA: sigma factor-like helix-turn-helix DNA-binding protein, partial [Marmoricola sp.]|nr:sigma factor-like helix-turn-helix DNA-binding protein [Marmoricola sp.]
VGDPRTTSVIAGSRLDLLEALDVLSATHPQFAEAVVLRDIQELDYSEIAEVMGVPLGTVKAWIHRARTTIRPLLVLSE